MERRVRSMAPDMERRVRSMVPDMERRVRSMVPDTERRVRSIMPDTERRVRSMATRPKPRGERTPPAARTGPPRPSKLPGTPQHPAEHASPEQSSVERASSLKAAPPRPSSKDFPQLREKVADRASYTCEYCQTPEQASFAPHQVDHIVSVKHGGTSGIDNLAFACTLCNRRKGSDLSSFDTETNQLEPLFHPRRDQWHEHFKFKGGELVGLTPSARATIHLLRLNHPHRVQERLVRFGWRWTRDSD